MYVSIISRFVFFVRFCFLCYFWDIPLSFSQDVSFDGLLFGIIGLCNDFQRSTTRIALCL